jgi:hypothetical protein
MSMRVLRIVLVGLVCLGLGACKKDQRPLVVSKIQAAAKLATTQVVIDKYIFATKEKSLLHIIRINEAYYAARSEATVKLGIDLDKIRKDDITIKDNTITVVLPPVEVLNFSYPFEKFETDHLVSQNKVFNKINAFDIEEYFRQGETDIRANLDYMGLIGTTQQNTRRMLRMMLAGLGYQEIYIEFSKQDKLVGAVLEPEPEPNVTPEEDESKSDQ